MVMTRVGHLRTLWPTQSKCEPHRYDVTERCRHRYRPRRIGRFLLRIYRAPESCCTEASAIRERERERNGWWNEEKQALFFSCISGEKGGHQERRYERGAAERGHFLCYRGPKSRPFSWILISLSFYWALGFLIFCSTPDFYPFLCRMNELFRHLRSMEWRRR